MDTKIALPLILVNMPCHDPRPDGRDLKAVEAAICINILYEKLGIFTRLVVPTSYDQIGFAKELDTLTNLLCSLIKKLSEAQLETIVYNGRDKDSRRLADWWEEHQKLDNERL